jgi:RNA polymerase sigma factor (sigma-70 family)
MLAATAATTADEIYRARAGQLQRTVAESVNTSAENVEDACSFAWTQLVRRRLEGADPYGWLVTVAIRQAIKLDRRSRRTDPIPEGDDGEALGPADPRDLLEGRERVIEARDLLRGARLTARQARLLVLQAQGFSYSEIAALTGDSMRTVERQLLRARGRIRATAQSAILSSA